MFCRLPMATSVGGTVPSDASIELTGRPFAYKSIREIRQIVFDDVTFDAALTTILPARLPPSGRNDTWYDG